MNTILYDDLKNRTQLLENTFLNFPNSDSSITANQDKIKAYILLTHSELEFYFEQIALNIKDAAVLPTIRRGNYSNIPLDLFVYTHKQLDPDSDIDYNARGEKVFNHFVQKIKKNNGIKKKDILSLLLPLGIEYHTITEILLNTLDTYGENRGLFAHTGSKSHATKILDRNTEVTFVKQLLQMIETLDDFIKTKFSIP